MSGIDPQPTSDPARSSPAPGGDEAASMPLVLCPSGCEAHIHLDELEPGDRAMLEALGVEHGGRVEICQTGSPCILKARSTRVGVGHEVAKRVRAVVMPTVQGRDPRAGA